MLTVLTTSTGDRLTTVDALKGFLGIATTSEDAQLEDAILAATDAVQTYVGYPLLRQRYVETLKGFGSLRLMVSNTPVRDIGSIMVGTQLVSPSEYEIENAGAGFISRELGWPWTGGVEWDLTSHVVPNSETRRFSVDYEAGFILTTGSWETAGFLTVGAGRTLPKDLERACLESAKSLYLARKRDGTIQSKRVGDLAVTYRLRGDVPTHFPEEALGILERYRRIT